MLDLVARGLELALLRIYTGITHRLNVCARANVVMTKWRAFRLPEPSCLIRVMGNNASQ